MRLPALLVALLLVFSGAAPAAAAAGAPADEPAAAAATDPPATTVDAPFVGAPADPLVVTDPGTAVRPQIDGPLADEPRVVMRVRLRADGSAEWRVEVRYALESPDEVTAFERFGRAYERGDADVGVDADFFRAVAAQASDATGREMRIRDETYSYDLDEEAGVGTLSVEFVWTNFLEETDGDALALGDAFRLPSENAEPRTWLSLLSDDQRLVVQTPPGYVTNTTSVEVIQRNDSIILDGPSTFEGDDGLVVTYSATEDPGPDIDEIPWALLIGGGVVVALLLVLAAVIARSRGDHTDDRDAPEQPPAAGPATATTNGGGSASTDAGASAAPEPGAERPVEGPRPPDGESVAAADDEEVDVDLLSDEERVEHLLERSGGRMKQATIVKETGWSDAKVSQLLSAMADEGRVDKLRLGRENLISLPDDEDDEDDTDPAA